MTDGTDSLWYANKTFSATKSTQYGVNTFFSYSAELDRTGTVTFNVMPNGMGFFYDRSSLPGPVYFKGDINASLCLRNSFPFLALVRNNVISWNETTYPPFYQERPSQTTTPTTKPTSGPKTSSSDFFSDSSFISTIWPIFLVVMLAFGLISSGSYCQRCRDNQEGGPLEPRPVAFVNVQRPVEETLPAYNQTDEMEGIVSTSTPATRNAESITSPLVASRRVSLAPSVMPSEVLSLENWSVEEVAAWVRLNGAGLSGAEKVRTLRMDGGVLKQLTVEELLQVFSLEDEYERDKLREALAVLKENNGETPPVYV
ncbi:hypothetical protein BJ741DRAFT_605741 [Chytriomyces cf. hyalinus JEL632]|nr:hypothetical protein BJ741DRAFT_605741 [Chytriomyces cf. hyalinus JEL632]